MTLEVRTLSAWPDAGIGDFAHAAFLLAGTARAGIVAPNGSDPPPPESLNRSLPAGDVGGAHLPVPRAQRLGGVGVRPIYDAPELAHIA
jgi:hypothetical protein